MKLLELICVTAIASVIVSLSSQALTRTYRMSKRSIKHSYNFHQNRLDVVLWESDDVSELDWWLSRGVYGD